MVISCRDENEQSFTYLNCENQREPQRKYVNISPDEVAIFAGLQKLTSCTSQNVQLCDENLNITHYEDSEVPSVFKVDSCHSCLIIEKPSDVKVPVPAINHNISQFSLPCSTPKKDTFKNGIVSEMDITGSPLAVHFEGVEPCLEASLQERSSSNEKQNSPFKFSGLPLSKARSICSYLRSRLPSLEEKGISLPPIWIASENNHNPSKIVFLGVSLNNSCVHTSFMTSSGPVNGEENLPTIDKINRHFSFGCLLMNVNTKVEATYEVLSIQEQKSWVSLSSQWTQPLSTLCTPGLNTYTTAILHLDLGDERSPIYPLFKELEILRNFIDGYNTNCLKWYQKKDGKKVNDILSEYFDNYSKKEERSKGGKEGARNLDQMVQNRFLVMRQNMEFPDDMWNILKESGNLGELTEAFNTIFRNVYCSSVRPQIHIRNETEFAVICRSLMRGLGELPVMEHGKPIEMLIQIGLEKIKKDYVSIFQACDLATVEQLSPYSSWSIKEASFAVCWERLEKLLAVWQAVVLLRSTLKLPNSLLSLFTSKTLADLEDKTIVPKEFKFRVETSLIKSIIDNVSPTIWTYETWGQNSENPTFGKSLKYAIKKDKEHFLMNTEEERGMFDIEGEKTATEMQQFFSICVVTNIDGF